VTRPRDQRSLAELSRWPPLIFFAVHLAV
jgi:hypothetical protein